MRMQLFTAAMARKVASSLKHGDSPSHEEVDRLREAVSGSLYDAAKRKQKILMRIMFGTVAFSIYFMLCMVSYWSPGAGALPNNILTGMDPANHPWIAVFVTLAVVITLIIQQLNAVDDEIKRAY